MRVGIAQTSPAFGRVEENIARCLSLLSSHDADLWVLPELFSTGYQFIDKREVLRYAEPIPQGRTTQALVRWAHDQQCFIVAGLPEASEGSVFNACVLVGPSGFIAVYRKIHLFYKETELFRPGDRPFAVHDIGPARIGLMVCFDHLFPESARSLALQGAELIAHPSNLVLPDLAQRTMALRALENGVFAATANRVGTETRNQESLVFTGQSQIVDPQGRVLARLSPTEAEVAVAEIDPKRARDKQITSHNDKLGDRRPDLYTMRDPIH